MPHQNTVFRQLANRLPWGVLNRLLAENGADVGVRRLRTRDMLLGLLFAQMSGAQSLRDIEAMLESHAARRYHAGLSPVHRSTLADACAKRTASVFTGLFAAMVASVQRKLRHELGACVRLIDSTTIPLNRLSGEWSRFAAEVCGIKAHVVYDPDADCPLYHAITARGVNDITAAKQMPIEAGATYVFDLGYYDYGWWAELDAADCRLVTRLKTNTPLHQVERLPVPEVENILSDRIGFLPARQANSRRNPMDKAVREIRVRIDSGKILRIVTNDLDAPACEIADLYRRRWAIELFFRWIKQTLKIKPFYGTSENAVRIQIAVALIAFLLIKLAHLQQTAVESLTRFARLVRSNVMHRRPLARLRRTGPDPDPVPIHSNRQLPLLWT